MLFPYSRFGGIEDMAAAVGVAEQVGFSTCVLPHHLLPPAWPRAAAAAKVWYDPLALSGFLAARTSTLVFRTGVLVVPYLQPVPLAKAIATLDIVSAGRFRLGVGAGWMRAEFRRLGLPFAERGAMTSEYVRAMRELWTSELPSFSGRYVSFEDVSFLPRPLSERIPIDFGGTGPLVFRRVAELGDGWCPMALTVDALAAGVSEIRSLLAAGGRDPDRLAVAYALAVDADPETAAMAHHASAEGGVGGGAPDSPAQARSLSAAQCIEAVAALRGAGVTDVTVELRWRSAAELDDRLRWFASEVIPACG
jgi:probable F420-dependent oxidoreductase